MAAPAFRIAAAIVSGAAAQAASAGVPFEVAITACAAGSRSSAANSSGELPKS